MCLPRSSASLLIFTYFITKTCFVSSNTTTPYYTFPSSFIFGVSTSSYQIEGAWNEDGKSENIWDRFTHTLPERIKDQSTGDVACDSYHKYKLDIESADFLGVDFYRFSISWTRILPTGFTNKINKKGVDYYNNIINNLLGKNIEPMITLYHWDLPQSLQDLGGWTNPLLADYFEQYASTAFELFGDRVKTWITFNEPKLICVYGYGEGRMAPGINASGIGDYLCGHTVLKAHSKAYRLYERRFKKSQQGKIGISIHTEWFEPFLDNIENEEASDRKLMFDFGWFAHPIFHPNGNYPQVMIDRVRSRSRYQNFSSSRLPYLTENEIDDIQGTADFLGLNMYTASLIEDLRDDWNDGIMKTPNYYNDIGVKTWKHPDWPQSAAKRLTVVPWALRKLLQWITEKFGKLNIIITENGYADRGELTDIDRVEFHQEYLRYLLQAMYVDNITVKGYTAWSLIDNFEWFSGYTEKYGLFAIDQKDGYKRVPKISAHYYKKVIEIRRVGSTAYDYSCQFLPSSAQLVSSNGFLICLMLTLQRIIFQ